MYILNIIFLIAICLKLLFTQELALKFWRTVREFLLSLINVRTPKEYTDSVKAELQLLADNFSVQGVVVHQDLEQGIVEVKIHRKPPSDFEPPKDFQLKLQGYLPPKSIKQFWNFYVRRVGTSLVIQSGECIKSPLREQLSTEDISNNTA